LDAGVSKDGGKGGQIVPPAEQQKRSAVMKFETFRLAGIVEAMEKIRQATTISTTVQ
jgi:hypothetical protein